MPDSPPERCRYTWPPDYEIGDDRRHQSCCWRETLPDTDCCAWHADPDETDEKTTTALQEARPDPAVREQNEPFAELLDGAVLAWCSIWPDISFSRVALRDADLTYAHLLQADFTDASLRGTDLTDASLREADFTDADLLNTDLTDADLFRTDLTDAKLVRTDLTNADLRGADLTDADLGHADLTEASLQEAVFSGTDVRYATCNPPCVPQGPETDTSELGASLEDAQLEGGTDLRGADLSGMRLYQVAFRDVRINDETTFGIEDGSRYGTACRYEYDPNAAVSVGDDDVPRLRAAAWTYRRLESLFEENAMDRRARNAHIRKKEAQREVLRNAKIPPGSWIGPLGKYHVSTLNWHLHRHGESLRRLIGVSGLLIGLCGLIYSVAGVARNNPTNMTYRLLDATSTSEALSALVNGMYFSVITFSTIGYGDFYPASQLSRLLVGIESLAGALFIALFVFVIGRRVAR